MNKIECVVFFRIDYRYLNDENEDINYISFKNLINVINMICY